MELDTCLYISILGSCSVTFGDCTISYETIGSRKFWTVLLYLILHRDREVPQTELIDVLYPGAESENPGNALKTLIHRVRCALDTLEFMDSHKMIVNVRGAYKWNIDMPFKVDLDSFVALCTKGDALDIPSDERLSYYLDALSLYKGNFYSKLALEPWADQISTKHRALYKTTVHSAVELMEIHGDYERIVSICRHAKEIDPYDENPYYYLIQGLVKLGDNKEAQKEYNKMSRLFYKQFGISPSNNLKKLYRQITKTIKNVETDLFIVQEDLRENIHPKGAFFCEYETFKDIYRLEVRSSARNGEPIYLALITLEEKPSAEPSLKTLNHHMDKLQDCVCLSLRRGDIYAKYSISQFIALLPTNTYESAIMVMDRMVKRFRRENPRAPFETDFSLIAMDLLLT